MIPYTEQPVLVWGGLHLSPFTLLALLAYGVGYRLVLRRCLMLGLDANHAIRLLAFVSAGAIAGAVLIKHLYVPWDRNAFVGISSFGGIWGALAGALLYGLHTRPLLPYLDVLGYVLPLPLLLGRTGCAIAHDHPGIRGDGILTVAYPGGPRYDLALIEMLFLILCIAAFHRLQRSSPRAPFAAIFLLSYGPFRILLDRLHDNPPLLFGHAVDTIAGAVSLILGLALLRAHQASPQGTADSATAGRVSTCVP